MATSPRRLLGPENISMGSVSGQLGAVSIDGSNQFILYPPVPGERIDCIFNRGDLPSVRQAIGHNVTVYGRICYAGGKAFPVRVDVDSFVISPPDDDLPTLLNACGLLHNATPSTEQIREVRDEWD